MKKVFLSFAALAFVATSSLTMTSCGSDDDNGTETPVNPNNPNNPSNPDTPTNPTTQTDNTISYNDDEYAINYQHTGLEFITYTAADGDFNGPAVYEIDGVGYNMYTQISATFNNAGNVVNYVTYAYVAPNPTIEFTDGELSGLGRILTPAQIQGDFILDRAGLVVNGQSVLNSLGSLEDGNIAYSVFQVGDAVANSELDFEYRTTSTYNISTEWSARNFYVKAKDLAGFFFSDLQEDEDAPRFPSALNNKLTSTQKQELANQVKKSKEILIKSKNLKLAKLAK